MRDLLNIENLKVIINSDEKIYRVVDDVSFKIASGATLGVVGESGCGKTMTAFSIMNILPPQAEIIDGKVFFENKNILEEDPKFLRSIRGKEISMVFQEPSTALNPVFTIGEQLCEVILAHTKTKRINAEKLCIELLNKVKIRNPKLVYNSYPHNLSGGMKQRAMIAMAIALRPKLLILDEPTTALDVTVQAHILSLIEELKNEFGMAIMFITHNLGIVAELADKIAVMYAGKIVELAEKKEIFYNIKHPYTKGLLESIPVLGETKERLKAIKGEAPDLSNVPSGCPFHPRCPFRIDICENVVPEYREISKDHFSRCHLAEKI